MIGEVEHDGTIYFASEFQRSCAMATSFHVEKLVGENVTHIIYNIFFLTPLLLWIRFKRKHAICRRVNFHLILFCTCIKNYNINPKKEDLYITIKGDNGLYLC